MYTYMIPFVMLFLVDVTDGLFAEIIRYCNHYRCLYEKQQLHSKEMYTL